MNNKGFMTIEASVLVPVIFCAIFVMLYALIFIYERSVLSASEYEALYTVPLENIRNKEVEQYISTYDYKNGILYCDVSMKNGYSFHKASCDGQLELFGESQLKGTREIDACVDRLRRWQLYDNTFSE